MGTDPHR